MGVQIVGRIVPGVSALDIVNAVLARLGAGGLALVGRDGDASRRVCTPAPRLVTNTNARLRGRRSQGPIPEG